MTAKLTTADPIAKRVERQSPSMSSHLVFGVCSEELECANHEPELIGVGEFPDAHAEGYELIPRDVRRALHDVLSHVVHSLFGRGPSGRGGLVSDLSRGRWGGMREKARCSKVARCDSAEEIQPLISSVLHGVSEARIFPSSPPTPDCN